MKVNFEWRRIHLIILQEWKKISCFRREDFSAETKKPEYIDQSAPEEVITSETQKSEYIEPSAHEEVVKSESNDSKKKNLPSRIQEVILGFILQIQLLYYCWCHLHAIYYLYMSNYLWDLWKLWISNVPLRI